MRMSTLFLRTLREDPADAELPSHRLMVRAAMIRPLGAGIYSLLPLGYRVIRKVEQVIREEMDAIGGQAGNIGRLAWLAAGYPEGVPGVTVDRQCGSSQQSLHFAVSGVVAGHYDVVVAGGEVGALVILEATARLVPGVMGNAASAEEESFRSGLLEYPQYTRPATFRGWEVPEVLRSNWVVASASKPHGSGQCGTR